MTHTPGPWVYKDKTGKFLGGKTKWSADYDGNDSGGCFSTVPIMATQDGKRTTIALCVATGWSSDRRLEANARLVASAPEILDALEIALGDILYLANASGQIQRFQGTIDLASAAIIKARGEP